jgi:hypothetical protein
MPEKQRTIYDQLDTKCGMVRLEREEIEALKKMIEEAGPSAQLRVVSDGLVVDMGMVI